MGQNSVRTSTWKKKNLGCKHQLPINWQRIFIASHYQDGRGKGHLKHIGIQIWPEQSEFTASKRIYIYPSYYMVTMYPSYIHRIWLSYSVCPQSVQIKINIWPRNQFLKQFPEPSPNCNLNCDYTFVFVFFGHSGVQNTPARCPLQNLKVFL